MTTNLNIKGYKLTNNLDLIAKEIEVTDSVYKLEDAFFLRSQQQQDGTLNIEYIPLTVLGTPQGKTHMGFDVELPKLGVLFSFDLNPGIVERYLSYVSPIDLSMAPSVKM